MFKKVLIANRGGIAVRVVRACRDLGIIPVAVYEPGDQGALHVRLAGEAYPLVTAQGYRNPDEMLEVAQRAGVDAIHPGYGLLSELPSFVRACEKAGIIVIGPGSDCLELARDKIGAIERARAEGIPTTKPTGRSFMPYEADAILAAAADIGYPLIVKACSGGRGRGSHAVRKPEQLLDTVRRSSAAAQAVYGNPEVYFEAAVLPSRYIEVPILGDSQGNIVHLGDRDGSIQRNTRNIIAEAPAPGLAQEQREQIWAMALKLGHLFGCRGACTIEFVVDAEGNAFFAEIKPRIQVEHLATEMITRIDAVREQLRIAAGQPLGYSQEQVRLNGVAMFCRVNAEDPWNNYLPSPGRIHEFRIPGGPNVRVDTYAYAGADVPVRYDSLLAKLVVWGATREECLNRLHRALQELHVTGVKTNIGLLRLIVNDPEFVEGTYTTEFSRRQLMNTLPPDESLRDLAAVAALAYMSRAQAARPTTPDRFTSGWHRDSRRLPQ